MIIFDGFKLIGISIMLLPLLISFIIHVCNRIEDVLDKRKQTKGKGRK